jgi:hypothetical protein
MAGGTKAFREKRYNDAYSSLCAAGQALTRVQAEGVRSSRDALVKYTQRLAADTVRGANADSAYTGTLRLLNPDSPAQICRAVAP